MRKLQVSLPDFRRLCIFKGQIPNCRLSLHVLTNRNIGIYPREPRNKRKASKSSTPSTTFYYTKDIQYLLHEPLLNKFRDHKALSKKIARSLGKGEVGDAARLEKSGSKKVSLDHIIKERYPTFVDALRDLDDALSLLFLFANLPSTTTVPPKTISLCQRLCLEFQHYLITSHSLRKSFLSIKGIYYQATIQGQDILWLVPYKFVQRVTNDVDFRIMGTFVEFYTTLLGFVNFRLYTSVGLIYPPKFNAKSDEQGGELGAFTLEGKGVESTNQIVETPKSQINGASNGVVGGTLELSQDIQEKIDALGELSESVPEIDSVVQGPTSEEIDETIDTFETTADGADALPQPEISGAEASSLFTNFTFFLSRETPRQPLEFILRAFGCKRVGWDVILGDGAFTNNEGDPNITHQIVDRPPLPQSSLPKPSTAEAVTNPAPPSQNLLLGSRVPGRTYVQPQWVWDCINVGRLLRLDLYAPGATLPPHLSPWIKPTKGVYDPSASLAEQERDGEAEEAAEALAEEEAAKNEPEGDEEAGARDNVAQTNSKALPATSQATNEDSESSSADDHGMTIADDSDSSSDSSTPPHPAPFAEDDFDGFSDTSLSPSENPISLHQAELEAEAQGLPFSEAIGSSKPLKGILKKSDRGNDARTKAAWKRREEEEELERRKGMMSRRKRKLVEKMMYGKKKGEEVAEELRAKRRKVERNGGLLRNEMMQER